MADLAVWAVIISAFSMMLLCVATLVELRRMRKDLKRQRTDEDGDDHR